MTRKQGAVEPSDRRTEPAESAESATAQTRPRGKRAGGQRSPIAVLAALVGNEAAGELALKSRALQQLAGGGGTRLPAEVQGALQETTGEEIGDEVRVQADAASTEAAEMLGAEAFTVGGAIHLRSPEQFRDRDLLLHEAGHAAQQKATAGQRPQRVADVDEPAERAADQVVSAAAGGRQASVGTTPAGTVNREPVDDVREKLSYGFVDWAVTDEEAEEALAILATISDAELASVMASLEHKYLERLIDNLPATARSGEQYQRVMAAMPEGAVDSFVMDKLDRGFFDWAVTDGDARDVWNVFANLPAAEHTDFLQRLEDNDRLGRLVDNSPGGLQRMHLEPWIRTLPLGAFTAQHVQLVDRVINNTADRFTAEACVEHRFNVPITPLSTSLEVASGPRKREGVDFDLPELKRLWVVLAQMPASNLEGNLNLDRISRFSGRGSSGTYYGSQNEAAIGLGDEDGAAFDETVRHEVGHAVEDALGWVDTLNEHQNASRGGWQTHRSANATARHLIGQANDAITTKLTRAQQRDVRRDLVAAMTGNDTTRIGRIARRRVVARPWFSGLPGPDKRAIRNSVVFDGIDDSRDKPWYKTGGGTAVGTGATARIYQESYAGRWTSYQSAARTRKVSTYQFRAPGEWFAEAYDFYYRPDPGGKGAALAAEDPNTKLWFDNNVDTMAAQPRTAGRSANRAP